MLISTAFPSKYISARDLAGQDVPVTIVGFAMEETAGEQHPVIYFDGMRRGMRLNKTNAFTIGDMFGEETDGWMNQRITLYRDRTDSPQGIGPCVRGRPQGASGPGAFPAQQATPPAQTEDQGVTF